MENVVCPSLLHGFWEIVLCHRILSVLCHRILSPDFHIVAELRRAVNDNYGIEWTTKGRLLSVTHPLGNTCQFHPCKGNPETPDLARHEQRFVKLFIL